MNNKNLNQNEQGRSMVEMLGVLAIIGVLSVMGIAGYRAAMTRHRANELLNEASKRAVVVAAQLSLQGLPTANLNEFKTNEFSGGTFSTDTITPTDGTFQIQINGVDESVCELMSGIVADNAMIKGFAPTACSGSSNTVQLTYNNDLGTGATTPAQAACPEGISRARDGSCSICDNGKVYLSYNSDPCQTSVSGCTSNDDCDSGYFCQLRGSNRNYPNSGTCAALDDPTPLTVSGLGTVIVSTFRTNYWSTENYCRAQGQGYSMIPIDDFACYANGTTLVTTNYCRNNVSCYPQGDTSHINDIVSTLYNAFPGKALWTTTIGCEDGIMYLLDLRSRWAGLDYKNNDEFWALCVKK